MKRATSRGRRCDATPLQQGRLHLQRRRRQPDHRARTEDGNAQPSRTREVGPEPQRRLPVRGGMWSMPVGGRKAKIAKARRNFQEGQAPAVNEAQAARASGRNACPASRRADSVKGAKRLMDAPSWDHSNPTKYVARQRDLPSLTRASRHCTLSTSVRIHHGVRSHFRGY